jgi:UDPglucose 6-dehydrogenase
LKIGFVGCGKLGLMVALTIESKGHAVKGYDVNRAAGDYLRRREIPFQEEHSATLLATTEMEMVSLSELCDWADILFLAPQTPHDPKYEGTTPLPAERVDFDYSYLIKCVSDVDACLEGPKTCVIISTVLPGTIEREVKPRISSFFRLVYEPLFIAMGTVYDDYLNPEFVLCGVDDPKAADDLEEFYKTIHDKPILRTDVRTAEGIKVFYNTFITAKTVLGNLYGEMAHRLGMNVDDIFRAISMADDRLLSPKYLQAGMGDGGGCHPRDNIALSFVARRENLSFDFFDSLMTAREQHTKWLASIVITESYNVSLIPKLAPVFILGRAFKPETNIEVGSPSLLLSNILTTHNVPHLIVEDMHPQRTGVYFIGTKHARYKEYIFPEGSTVIDPFRYLPQRDGIKLIQIGGKTTQAVMA